MLKHNEIVRQYSDNEQGDDISSLAVHAVSAQRCVMPFRNASCMAQCQYAGSPLPLLALAAAHNSLGPSAAGAMQHVAHQRACC